MRTSIKQLTLLLGVTITGLSTICIQSASSLASAQANESRPTISQQSSSPRTTQSSVGLSFTLPQLAQIIAGDSSKERLHQRPLQRAVAAATPTTRPTTQPDALVFPSTYRVAQVNPQQIAAPGWEFASFPLENFEAYTSPFGYRQSPIGGYSQEFHYGLDMAAASGSYIRAWATGVVLEVSDDTNCGTSIVVQSGSWRSTYCHMQGSVEDTAQVRYLLDPAGGIQIRQGQTIQAGTRVGRVGMTGRTTGPHLHWTLKYGDRYVDPALVLRAMYASQQTAQQSQ
jgi:murein DD-endopeptidase MepM/ murein hydrolase activator NlpD